MSHLNREQNFYHQQNIKLRKQIKQIDLEYKYQQKCCAKNRQIQSVNSKRDVNFLVIGPKNSGKSSLLQTIASAFTNSKKFQPQTIQIPDAFIKRYYIKKSQKYKISGLSKVKQVNYGQFITGFEVQQKPGNSLPKQQNLTSQKKLNKYAQKYSKILNLIDQKVIGCCCVKPLKVTFTKLDEFIKGNYSTFNFGLTNVRVILVVFSILQKIQTQELNCLKFLIADLKQKGLKTIIVLNHTDQLSYLNEFKRLSFIEEKINFLQNQLDIDDRDDFICIENGPSRGKNTNQKLIPKKISKNADLMKRKVQKNSRNFFQNSQSAHYKSKCSLYNKPNQVQFSRQTKNISRKIIFDNKLEPLSDIPISNIYKRHFESNYQFQNQLNPEKLRPQNFGKSKYSNTFLSIKKAKENQSEMTYPEELNQETIFYALKLLVMIIKENDKVSKEQAKGKKFIDWFCG